MSNLDYYLVDRKRRRLLGAIPKVGSSSLKAWISGSQDSSLFSDKQYTLCRQKDQQVLLANWPVFLVVRDPVERLFSAWQNKFVENKTPFFAHFARGCQINTFEGFVTWLTKRNLDTENPHWRPQTWFRIPRSTIVPLFALGVLCPGVCQLNASLVREKVSEEMRKRIESLYASDMALYKEAKGFTHAEDRQDVPDQPRPPS